MKQKKIVLKTPSTISVNLILLIFSFMLFNNIVKAQNNKWVAPKEADNIKNPLAGNTTILKDAKVLYTSYCVPCHGEKGKGDGVAAAGLSTKPADHSGSLVQNQTDGALFWELSEGHNPMPAYKTALTETQRWSLINYIRTLAKTSKKS